MIVRSVNLWNC